MIIKEGEPWLMWPEQVSYGLNKGKIGETFEGDTDFTLGMRIKVLTKTNTKRTLFAKLPNYCGVDLEPNNCLLLILKLQKNNEEIYRYLVSEDTLDYEYNFIFFRYSKENKIIEVMVNEKKFISYSLEEDESISVGHEPHIIFGSGNFPSNGFNLNYCSYDINFLSISKSYRYNENVIGLFDFKKHTDYKVFDLTGNCNFLHKII